jgi:hypothetical protein
MVYDVQDDGKVTGSHVDLSARAITESNVLSG